MTYTHCRGCGRELAPKTGQVDDGLCGRLMDPKRCSGKFLDWLEPRLVEGSTTKTFGSYFWRTPGWTIAVDEWLQATR